MKIVCHVSKDAVKASSRQEVPVNEYGAANCYFNVYYRKSGTSSPFRVEKMRSPFQSQVTVQLESDTGGTVSPLQDYDVMVQVGNEQGLAPNSSVVRITEVPLRTIQF